MWPMVTCHHHFWKWWWLSPPLFQSGICNLYKNTSFSLYFRQENCTFLATRSVLWPKICRKCESGLGSARGLAGGAHDAPSEQIGFTFLVPAHPGSPGKRAVKRVCVWYDFILLVCLALVTWSMESHWIHGCSASDSFSLNLRVCVYRVGLKTGPQTHDHNSVKSWPIYKLFSLEDFLVNLQLNGY